MSTSLWRNLISTLVSTLHISLNPSPTPFNRNSMPSTVRPYSSLSFFSPLTDRSLDSILEITPESLQDHISRVLARLHIESLVHGNMLKDEAVELSNTIEGILNPQPLTTEELKSHQALIVPEGTLPLFLLLPWIEAE